MRPRTLLKYSLPVVVLTTLISASAAIAQTTGFTYQGRLTDGVTAANGNYDLQFALWDTASGGAQIGTTQTVPNVAVSAGIFTVSLDFGANAFPGANRWLEIGARLSGGGAFSILSPRQPITPTPYAIRSLNASSADAVTVNGVPGGSGSYIQNATTPQASANFNISGNGTAGGTLSGKIVNATTQYNIGGSRILSATGENVFAGADAGTSNIVPNAGLGGQNAFFGQSAGTANSTGYSNSFFGAYAGFTNNTGTRNTAIGAYANVGSDNLTNATAIGWNAHVDQSDSLVLGSVAGVNFATSSVKVGIGTTTPQATLDIAATGDGAALLRFSTERPWVFRQAYSGSGTALRLQPITGLKNFEITAAGGTNVATFIGDDANPRVGIGTTVPDQTLSVYGNASKNSGGSWLVFSDERLKNIMGRFTPGLKAVMQLRPIRYEYKPENALGLKSYGEQIGFGAQAVQKIIPEAVIRDDQGYLLVNNDPIMWTMLNAIKEQQGQIESLRTQNAALNARLRVVEKVLRKKRVGSARRRP